MSRDDQMFSIFLSLGNFSKNFSKKFLLVASCSSYEKYTPQAYTILSLNFKFRIEFFLWRNDSSQSIFLIYLGLFGDQNSFQIVAAGQKTYEQTEYL